MTEDSPRDEAFHLAGDRLGKFVILSELGRGSMGVVYEAFQSDLKRKVALKILPANITLDIKQVRRFRREAESVARLRHDNVIQIYEVGEIDRTHYFAMEMVEGQPLGEDFGRDKESVLRAAWIGLQAARGLAHAHERGVIHRDIKPGNLLLDREGRVVVTDFGLARLTDSATLTSTDAIVGTPKYMSPEQILPRADQPVDGRTDVYSLGATLFQIITGRPPFEAPTVQGFIKACLEERPASPRRYNRQVPHDLATIVLRCLEKDPDDRYAGAAELADDLERLLAGERIHAKPKGTLALAAETLRRHRVVAALSAVALLAVVLGLVFGGKAAEQSRRARFQLQLRGIENNSDLDLAVQQVEDLADRYPGNQEVAGARARVYGKRALRELEKSRPDREVVVEDLEKAGRKGSFWHLMLLIDLRRHDEARAVAEALPSGNGVRALALARLALEEGRYEDVHRLIPESPGKPPEQVVLYGLTRSQAYQATGNLTQARALLRLAAQAGADVRQAWLRIMVQRRFGLVGGTSLTDFLDTLGGAVGESMRTLTRLWVAMTPRQAQIARVFIERILQKARVKAAPAADLEEIARKRLETAEGRDRAIADLMLAIARLSQGEADEAHEALDDADSVKAEDLQPYVHWCRSLVYRAQESIDDSIAFGRLAIESALASKGTFPALDLEPLFRHTTLLVEDARRAAEGKSADKTAVFLRAQLATLSGAWVSELLRRLSP